jgi:hypothetical protein
MFRLGRVGGVVALLFGVGFGALNYTLAIESLHASETRQILFYSPPLMVLAGAFGLTGVFLLVTGGTGRQDTGFSGMSASELAAVVKTRHMPFCVCLECRVILPHEVFRGACPSCGRRGSCLEVFNPSDRATVLAAIQVEP